MKSNREESILRSCMFCGFLMTPVWALAADTVETWDVGATDVDFYTGYDGLGSPAGERSIYSDLMLGYGIVDGLCAYFGTTLHGNDYFGGGGADLYLGIFGTPINTQHFDLDLFLNVGVGGQAFSELVVTPSLELNWDATDNQSTWGAYLRAGFPLSGDGTSETVFALEVNPGAYLTVTHGHQLFVEFDVAFHQASTTQLGGVALGYNVTLTDNLELISQVYLDVPQSNEEVVAGVMVGFIATLPSAS